jgi:endonuclease/exonuclease/phosphatase family metal-dependent hydrolase
MTHDQRRSSPGEAGPPPRRRGRWRLRLTALATLVGGAGATAAARGKLQTPNFSDPGGPRFAACCAAGPERVELRVVTFNIEHAREIEGAIQLFHSSSPVRDPDFVMLQEMDEDGVRRIAAALSLGNYVYYPATISRTRGRNFGNAILSRWPLEEDAKLILPHHALFDGKQRIAVRATARIGERRVRLYSLHLATVIEQLPGARRDQALAVVNDADTSGDPVIIAGDTNAPGLWKVFDGRGYRCVSRDLGGTSGPFAIDHIFVRGLDLRSPPSRGVIRGHDHVSDHRPVWAVLEPPSPSVAAAGR